MLSQRPIKNVVQVYIKISITSELFWYFYCTVFMFISLWTNRYGAYFGIWIISFKIWLRNLRKLWISAILDLHAVPQSCNPYVQIGLIFTLQYLDGMSLLSCGCLYIFLLTSFTIEIFISSWNNQLVHKVQDEIIKVSLKYKKRIENHPNQTY